MRAGDGESKACPRMTWPLTCKTKISFHEHRDRTELIRSSDEGSVKMHLPRCRVLGCPILIERPDRILIDVLIWKWARPGGLGGVLAEPRSDGGLQGTRLVQYIVDQATTGGKLERCGSVSRGHGDLGPRASCVPFLGGEERSGARHDSAILHAPGPADSGGCPMIAPFIAREILNKQKRRESYYKD